MNRTFYLVKIFSQSFRRCLEIDVAFRSQMSWQQCNEALKVPSLIPIFFTKGITTMIPKGNDSQDPKNYQPIMWLPSLYKALIAIITIHINRYLKKHNILVSGASQVCREVTTDHLKIKCGIL
ncbi:hypothetical protein HHI36_010531 [Cryptolaemus montrouzieri]|uniref:Reverse transcriptase n=1 Tax=Cryptolaemus montrouzieri TaxID=559131 RepID=A0ABD2MJ22_9CUCU